MAKVLFDEKGNAIGLSGKLGDVVFRYNKSTKKTIECSPPRKSNKPRTAKQVEAQRLFKEAVAYARNICDNPKQYLAIKATLTPGQTVWGSCVAKYMREKKAQPKVYSMLESVVKFFNG